MSNERKTRYVAAKLFEAERLLDDAADLLGYIVVNYPDDLGDDYEAAESLWKSLRPTQREGPRLDLIDVAFRLIRRGDGK